MELRELAESVLYASDWGAKLVAAEPGGLRDERPGQALALTAIPDFPGRPAELGRVGRTLFPDLRRLERAPERGRVLHFFANHELLAMELMALALLRFPDAPRGWRMGVAHTLLEEQAHMRLYRDRMQSLGVGFGDLAVNAAFWRRMRGMRSPLDYVTMMSLTFEQANLDYCVHYRDAVTTVGDAETAAILQRVYEDEIGHVGHGSEWFDRLRPDPDEDRWDAYQRLLPPPLTAVRARGIGFDLAGRRRAGLDERFIAELAVCGASKGRSPVLWWFNPDCEREEAAGAPVRSPLAQRIARDLAVVPGLLARSGDVVWTERPPETGWRADLQAAGWSLPEYRCGESAADLTAAERVAALEPWGWSPRVAVRFEEVRERIEDCWTRGALVADPVPSQRLASKLWSTLWLQRRLAEDPPASAGPELGGIRLITAIDQLHEAAEAAEAGGTVVLKAAFGSAGAGNRMVDLSRQLPAAVQRWAAERIAADGGLVLEPQLARVCDLSVQLHIEPDGDLRWLGIRRQVVDDHGQWQGVHIGAGFPAAPELRAWLHSGEAESPLGELQRVAEACARDLAAAGYRGAVGIDALVYRRGGGYALHPLVDCNPRWTMGRVAVALEEHLAPGARAWWGLVSLRELAAVGQTSASAWLSALQARYPLRRRGRQLEEGVLATGDVASAEAVIPVLLVGEARAALPAATPGD